MKKIWFKAKEYGYGWCPCTWQGWLVILAYVIAISALAFIFESAKIKDFTLVYLASVFFLTGLLIYISYKKGEKPGWRWGKKDK